MGFGGFSRLEACGERYPKDTENGIASGVVIAVGASQHCGHGCLKELKRINDRIAWR